MHFNRLGAVCKYLLLLFLVNISAGICLAQIGLQYPTYILKTGIDSSSVTFPKPILPLRNWFDHTDQYINLKHETDKLDINQYISRSNIVPENPFQLDVRSSSYYVPRMVRDELNLMMNRPRESGFVPILPAAFLALQLAGKYLLIQKKTEISTEDIERGKVGFPILSELWKENPQTASQLYKKGQISENFTMVELQRLINILIDNKLIKRKLIENGETQYFYALEKKQYFQLIERVNTKKLKSDINRPSIEINHEIKN